MPNHGSNRSGRFGEFLAHGLTSGNDYPAVLGSCLTAWAATERGGDGGNTSRHRAACTSQKKTMEKKIFKRGGGNQYSREEGGEKNIPKRRGESIFKRGGGRKKNSKEGEIWTPGHQPLAHILSPIPETVRVITWTQISYEFSPKESCLELTIPLG